jgi:hypothetical protein
LVSSSPAAPPHCDVLPPPSPLPAARWSPPSAEAPRPKVCMSSAPLLCFLSLLLSSVPFPFPCSSPLFHLKCSQCIYCILIYKLFMICAINIYIIY